MSLIHSMRPMRSVRSMRCTRLTCLRSHAATTAGLAALGLMVVLPLVATAMIVMGVRQITLEGAFVPSPVTPEHIVQLLANLLGLFALVTAPATLIVTLIAGLWLKTSTTSITSSPQAGEELQRRVRRLLAWSLMLALSGLATPALLPVISTTPTSALTLSEMNHTTTEDY